MYSFRFQVKLISKLLLSEYCEKWGFLSNYFGMGWQIGHAVIIERYKNHEKCQLEFAEPTQNVHIHETHREKTLKQESIKPACVVRSDATNHEPKGIYKVISYDAVWSAQMQRLIKPLAGRAYN